MKKICSNCSCELDIDLFYKRSGSDRYHSWCKQCTKASSLIYKKKSKDKVSSSAKEYYFRNKSNIQLYRSTRSEQHKEYMKNWKRNNPQYMNTYMLSREAVDIDFKIMRRLRGRLRFAVQSNKQKSTPHYVGCTKEELINHLITTLPPGFTLDNYLNRKNYPQELKLDIDHIIPFKYFIDNGGLTEEALHKVMHYSNLRFLPHLLNLSKGGRY